MAHPKAVKHHLEWEKRLPPHRHTWLPFCSCGRWVGIPMRTKRKGAAQHRIHLKNVQPNRRRGGRRQAGPRPVTPHDELPEVLR